MFKSIGKVIFALALLFIAYLFFQAGQSAKVDDERELALAKATTTESADLNLQRIAFGSCNRQDKPQGYWDVIASYQPDQWLWLGDNIYGDSDDPAVLRAKYQQQLEAAPYANFVQQVPVYGTYDDHDYGLNDGGKEWSLRDTAKTLMLDFLNVPSDDPARSRAGGYQTYLLGEPGQQVRLILLDTRYFRDPLVKSPQGADQRYEYNIDGDILGAAQWQWLEGVLAENESQATIIVSSIQVLTTEHGYEKWAQFPVARERLLDMAYQYGVKNLLFLSGDRHLAEAAVAMMQPMSEEDWGLGQLATANEEDYTLLEITSSGLTHSYQKADEANTFRISPLVGERNFGLLTIYWSVPEDPTLLVQVLSPENQAEFFRVAMRSGKILPNADQLDYNQSMTRVLKPCPESPNCVSSQTTQEDKKLEPMAYSGDMATAKKQLKELVDDMSRTKLVEEDANYLHFSFTTLPIPFKDDVEFLFDDAAKLIHFRSASRVGYSDLGVNARRMKKISRRWQELNAN